MERRKGLVILTFFKKKPVTFVLIFSFIVILLLAWLSFGKHGLIDLYNTQKEKERCLHILRNLQEKNRLLANEIRRLKEDKKYLESVARKQLGMVKENEIIYRFKNQKGETIKKDIQKKD